MALNLNDVLINIAGRNDDARSAIEGVRRELEKVPRTTKVKLQAEVVKALAEVQGLSEELRKIDRSTVEADVSVAITAALAKLETFRQVLRTIPDEKNIRLDMRGSLLQKLSAVEKGVASIGPSLAHAQQATVGFTSTVGQVVSGLRALGPVVQGAGIALIIVLIPALIAVTSAALGAVAAIGVLATALLGALGPAVAVIGAVVSRFTKILEARKSAEAARSAAAKSSAGGDSAAAAAADDRRRKEEAVADALRGTEAAERNLQAAKQQAQEAITQANQRVIDSQADVRQSAHDVQVATVEAYRAMEDAVEAASDAVDDLTNAQLGQEQSSIDLRQAELDLKKFRQEIGLTGESFDGMFKKFTDVDFDTRGLASALSGQAGTSSLDEEQKLDLEQKILNVQKARQGEKDATDQVSDSVLALARARQDEIAFQKQGIGAYAPLTAAIRAQDAAQRSLADAVKQQGALTRAGVANAPAVLAAVEAQLDAERRLRDARANKKKAPADNGAAEAAAKAARDYGKLSKAEQAFFDQLSRTGKFLRGVFGPATDAVFRGLTSVLQILPDIIKPLQPALQKLGVAMGNSLGAIAVMLADPKIIAGLQGLIEGSAQLVGVLGGPVYQSLLEIFLNLANAAMPLLIGLMQDFTDTLAGISDDTTGLQSTNTFLTQIIDNLQSFLNLGSALLGLFGALIGSAGLFGNDLLDSLAGIVRNFTKFIRSAKGSKKIQQFFEDVLPFVKEFGKSLVLAFTILGSVFQFIAPFLTGFLKVINFFLKVIRDVVGALNALVSNPVGRWVREFIGSFIGFGFVARILKTVFGFLFNMPTVLAGVGRFLGNFFNPLMTGIRAVGKFLANGAGIPGAVGRLIAKAAQAVAGGAGRLFNAGKSLVAAIARGIRSVLGTVVSVGGSVVRSLVSGIRSVFGFLFTASRGVVAKVVGAIRSAFNFVTQVGRDMLGGLIKGFTTIGKAVFNAIKGLGTKIVEAVKKVLGIHSPSRVMQGLGASMLAGLIKGFTSGDVVAFIKKHLGGIPGLAADLALGALKLPGKIIKAVVPGLAKGGILMSDQLFRGGEKGKEAVLPLTRSVFSALGRSIAANMRVPQPHSQSPALASAAAGTRHVEYNQTFNIPPSPSGTMPDARYVSSQIGMLLAARGLG